MNIYTDGACRGNPGPGGWGVIICHFTNLEKLSGREKNTTNNRMELTAILKTLIWIYKKHKELKIDTFNIHSDSAYAINSINNGWLIKWSKNDWKTKSGEVKNKDIWLDIFAYLKLINSLNMKVNFIKVKGHSGDTFNEMVDILARGESLKYRE